MNKLFIAALALGALSFTQSAVSAPAASPTLSVTQSDCDLLQQIGDRDQDWKHRGDWDRDGRRDRGYHHGWDHKRGWWGRDNGQWRDDRWRDKDWRRGHKRDWDNDHRRGND
ncbi:MAG: hypothetical protein ACR65X_11480 [Methylocystis sp.]